MPQYPSAGWFQTAMLLLLIVPVLIGGYINPSYADGANVTVRLSPEQAAQFHDALAALETQGHVTLVAEGSPMTPTLVGKVVPGVPLTREQIHMVPLELLVPMPLGEAVARIAKAYDYSVERRPGLFLLRKRYTDPADLPGVTLEECTLAMRDIHTLLATYAPNPDGNKTTASYATDIVDTFSPEQQVVLQSKATSILSGATDKGTSPPNGQSKGLGTNGLPLPPVHHSSAEVAPALTISVADLNSQQHAAVWQFVTYIYVQDVLDKATNALFLIQQAPQTSIGVSTIDDYRPVIYTLFGYQYPGIYSFSPFWYGISDTVIQSRLAHPTKEEEMAIQEREDAAKNDGHVTLEQEAIVLNGRGLRVAVDPALRAKPITVVGEADSPPAQVVQAMADIYGLRTFVKDDGMMALTRRSLRIPDDITGLPEQVRRLIPDPLAHAIHMKDEADVFDRLQGLAPYTPDPPPSNAPASGAAQTGQPSAGQAVADDPREDDEEALHRFDMLPDRIKQPALERLRAALDRGPTPAQDGKLVPLSSLSDADRADFALSFLTDFLRSASMAFGRPTPYNVTHFDSFTMKVRIYSDPSGSGKAMVGIALDPPDNSGGGSHDGPGIFNVPYTPGH